MVVTRSKARLSPPVVATADTGQSFQTNPDQSANSLIHGALEVEAKLATNNEHLTDSEIDVADVVILQDPLSPGAAFTQDFAANEDDIVLIQEPSSPIAASPLDQFVTPLGSPVRTRSSCPIPGCHKSLSSVHGVCMHIRQLHLNGPANVNHCLNPNGAIRPALMNFLRSNRRWLCATHLSFHAHNRSCNQCAQLGSPDIPTGENLIVVRHDPASAAPSLANVGGQAQAPIPDEEPDVFLPATEAAAAGFDIWLAIREAPVYTHKFIQFKLRRRFGRILTGLLKDVVANPLDLDKLALLQLFPKCLLRTVTTPPGLRGYAKKRVQWDAVKQALDAWQSGPAGQRGLWNKLREAQATPSIQPEVVIEDEFLSNTQRRICKDHVENGRLGAAIRVLGTDGLAALTEEVMAELSAKHPARVVDPVMPPGTEQPLEIDSTLSLKLIRSFPRNSACGRDGLRAVHLVDMYEGSSGQDRDAFLLALTAFINCCLSGALHPDVAPYLCGAPLYPLRKKTGGIRPIAVGEVLRRLVSKAACVYGTPIASNEFMPHQLGVGIPDGAVAIVHSLNHLVRLKGQDENMVLLKVDFTNAFNLVDRDRMFAAVHARLPKIAPWVRYCYSDKPFLFVGDSTLRSERGVQQGDPLGPLLFAVTLMPLIQKIAEACPALNLNAWFLDDGNIAGPIDQVALAFEILAQDCPLYGLELNLSKCELWWPTITEDGFEQIRNSFPEDIPISSATGTDCLGAPVGSPEFAVNFLANRLAKIQSTLDSVARIGHAHYELALLRKCAGFPKFVFALRTVDPLAIGASINQFDEIINQFTANFLSGAVPAHIRDLIGLPVGMGGLGIYQASHIALSAYVSSLFDSSKLQEQILLGLSPPERDSVRQFSTERLQSWINIHQIDIPLDSLREDLADQSHRQRYLSGKVHDNTLAHLKEQGDADFQALLHACLAKDSGLWTTVLPNRLFKTVMLSGEYSAALKMRYGIQILSSPSVCYSCNQSVDLNSRHTLVCSGIHKARHDAVRNALEREARHVHIPVIPEPINLFHSDPAGQNNQRPADLFFAHLLGPRPTCVDVSIVSPFQHLAQSSSTPGFNAERQAAAKKTKYMDLCHQHNMDFLPFVMESIGGFSQDCYIVLKLIGRRQAEVDGVPVSKAIGRLKQRISFVWQKWLGCNVAAQIRHSASLAGHITRYSPTRMFQG